MRLSTKAVQFISLSLALFATGLVAQEGVEPLKGIEGQEAPPLGVSYWIQLPDGKETVDVSDYRGKILVMLFFQHADEFSHDLAFPALKKLFNEFKGNDEIDFLAIQTPFRDFADNTEAKLEETADEYNLPIPMGHLAKIPGFPSVNVNYQTGGAPWWVIVDKDGMVEFNGFFLDSEIAIENLNKMIEGKSLN